MAHGEDLGSPDVSKSGVNCDHLCKRRMHSNVAQPDFIVSSLVKSITQQWLIQSPRNKETVTKSGSDEYNVLKLTRHFIQKNLLFYFPDIKETGDKLINL